MSRRTHISTDNTIDLRQRRRRIHTAWHANGQRPDLKSNRIPQLAIVRLMAKTALTPGAVVWAHIPYVQADGYKMRPAIISRVVGRAVTVRPATSSEFRQRYPGRHDELVDPAAAGLQRATGVRRTEVTLDLLDIVALIGRLGDADESAVLGPADSRALPVAA